MNGFDFKTPIDRAHTASLKWDRYGNTDIIPLWVADMDFKSPPAVIEALQQRVAHGVFGYGASPTTLTELVCELLARRYGWLVAPEEITWLPGLVCGLNVACRAFAAEHDAVMTFVPIYPPFLTAPGNSGRKLVTVPLMPLENRWQIDFGRLEQCLTPETRLMLLCNPHNPTGRVYSRLELEQLVRLCDKRGIVICSDEIHCDLVLDADKRHIPTATIDPAAAERTVTLMAPSKTFNIPGLACSFAVISNRHLRQKFLRSMAGIVPQVNILGFTAAEAAYRQGWDWLAALLQYLKDNRNMVEEEIGTMAGLSMGHVEATYLAWIDAREIDGLSPARILEKFGLGLSEGSDFGLPGFVRLNFGCSRSLLQEALLRLRRAVRERNG